MAVSDADGIVYYRYIYDTYGELSDITTDDGVSLKSSEQLTEYRLAELANATGIDYLYNGQYGVETDSNGLYYMRARYYDQDIKRFINRDVVSGDIGNSQSLNRYCYVQGNPVSLTDPFGLCPDGNSQTSISDISAIGWLLQKMDPSGWLLNKYSNVVSPRIHLGLDIGGILFDGADALNGIMYFLEGNIKLGIEYTLRGLTFYGALIGGPVGVAMILLGIGFNIGFAIRGTAGAIDRAYTDYKNGTFGWHNVADMGLNSLGVAGGIYVGAKSLGRVADISVSRSLDTPPETVGNGESDIGTLGEETFARYMPDGRKVTDIANLPGSAGIKMSRRLTTDEMTFLTREYGVEFAQVYHYGAGKNGGGGYYVLYSGTIDSVNISSSFGPKAMLINHTHPSGSAYPSLKDMKLLQQLQRVGSPQKVSKIIPIGKEQTVLFDTNGVKKY